MHPDNPTSADHAAAVDLASLDAARNALARARDYTLGLQDAEGWWQSGFETNVTMDAEDLLLREFLGLHDDELIAATARWIRSKQRDDGTWATYFGGPGELSTTVEGYLALRLAGDDPDAPHMKQARIWILDQGGLEATRVFTRIWLALSGLWSWDDLPVIPPEMIYMPSWLPLNIYDWACWARQTIVALAVLQSFRPSRPLPFTVDELRTGVTPRRPPADPWARVFVVLDKALHRYRPVKSAAAGRAAALRRLDHRPAGEGRLLGRHPAAVGVLADGAEHARLRRNPPDHGQGPGGPGPVHALRGLPGRPDAQLRRVPGAGLGHRPDDGRARRRGTASRSSRAGERRAVGPRRGDPRAGRLAGAQAEAGPGRLVVLVRERRLPRQRRHRARWCSRCAGWRR